MYTKDPLLFPDGSKRGSGIRGRLGRRESWRTLVGGDHRLTRDGGRGGRGRRRSDDGSHGRHRHRVGRSPRLGHAFPVREERARGRAFCLAARLGEQLLLARPGDTTERLLEHPHPQEGTGCPGRESGVIPRPKLRQVLFKISARVHRRLDRRGRRPMARLTRRRDERHTEPVRVARGDHHSNFFMYRRLTRSLRVGRRRVVHSTFAQSHLHLEEVAPRTELLERLRLRREKPRAWGVEGQPGGGETRMKRRLLCSDPCEARDEPLDGPVDGESTRRLATEPHLLLFGRRFIPGGVLDDLEPLRALDPGLRSKNAPSARGAKPLRGGFDGARTLCRGSTPRHFSPLTRRTRDGSRAHAVAEGGGIDRRIALDRPACCHALGNRCVVEAAVRVRGHVDRASADGGPHTLVPSNAPLEAGIEKRPGISRLNRGQRRRRLLGVRIAAGRGRRRRNQQRLDRRFDERGGNARIGRSSHTVAAATAMLSESRGRNGHQDDRGKRHDQTTKALHR